VDVSPSAIACVRQRAAEEGATNARFRVGDAVALTAVADAEFEMKFVHGDDIIYRRRGGMFLPRVRCKGGRLKCRVASGGVGVYGEGAKSSRRKAMRRNTKGDDEYRLYTTEAFGQWARFYDPFLSLFRLKGVRKETVEMSGVRRKDKVLDVCTGTGDVALEFARRCDDVTGIDLSAEMLTVARRKDKESSIRFLQMDATKLDFADNEFDVSSISLALHDMPPGVGEEVLQEMGRVTKGKIVIVDYNPPRTPILRAFYIAIVSLWESKYFPDFARGDFEGLLARCGLQVERGKPAYFGFLWIRICCPQE